LEMSAKPTINNLLRVLRRVSVLEEDEYALLQSVIKLANEAAHGNSVQEEYAIRAIESAKAFVDHYIPFMTGGMDRVEAENG